MKPFANDEAYFNDAFFTGIADYTLRVGFCFIGRKTV
jgi:hypothetical protein